MNILNAPFILEMGEITQNMYRMGYNERNGGNISLRLDEADLVNYINPANVLRRIPTGFSEPSLTGMYFLVTGTGKYFRHIASDPEGNLGIVRIADGGATAELLWGFRDGGKFTSEFPAHMKSHAARLKIDPENRVVLHCHPANILAMTYVLTLSDRAFSRALWQMCTECIVVFPEGVGVLPWMLCGTNEIGDATAEKMKEYRAVIWGMHGIYGIGKTLDEAFGLVETIEKAAQIYMLTAAVPHVGTISDAQLITLAEAFGVDYRREFLE